MSDLVQKLVGALEGCVSTLWGLSPALTDDGCYTDDPKEKAARAALSAAKDGGWQDIEQAPRDPVCQDGNNHYTEYILAWWPGAMAPTRCRWWFRDDTPACNFIADGGYAVFPTKWQPLPNPPKGDV